MKTLGHLLHDYLGEAYAMMRRSDSGVRRKTDAEAVHTMRVGARRMRSALRLFDNAYPSPALRPLQSDLKWLAGGLGDVHDLALHLESLAEESIHSPAPAELGAFIAAVEQAYQKRRGALRRMLSSKRYRRLMATARAAASGGSTGLNPALALRSPRKEAPALLKPWIKKCRRRARQLKAGSPDRTYHRFRLLGKRTRYAVQCLGEAAPRPLARLARRLEKMQTLLGRNQDEVTRLAALRAFLETPAGREAGPRRAASRLLARRLKQHRKSRARIAKAVDHFARSRMLERAVKAVNE